MVARSVLRYVYRPSVSFGSSLIQFNIINPFNSFSSHRFLFRFPLCLNSSLHFPSLSLPCRPLTPLEVVPPFGEADLQHLQHQTRYKMAISLTWSPWIYKLKRARRGRPFSLQRVTQPFLSQSNITPLTPLGSGSGSGPYRRRLGFGGCRQANTCWLTFLLGTMLNVCSFGRRIF